MITNYLKTAIRNLIKQRYYSSINIIGLAISMASAMIIFLWVSHESSFDKFHDKYENIYRITSDASMGGQKFNLCYAPSPLANELADKCPEVLLSTRTSPYFDVVYQYNNNFYKEKKVILADSNFFKLFSFPFIEGNPNIPFTSQRSVILTKSTAKKYFGNEKAFGKVLLTDGKDPVIVSGVIDDIPSNSHIQFNMAIYLNNEDDWGNFNRLTYILLKENYSKNNITSSLEKIEKDIVNRMTKDFGMSAEQFKNAGNYIKLNIQPLKSIHLNSNLYGELESSGNKTMVIFFSIVAILILFIASINYMNLSTAYYDNRRMEVGIRKANGATRGRLIWQFLSESLLISIAAYIVSIILLKLFLPLFNNYFSLNINEGIYNHWYFTILVLALVIVLGFVSGLYPAAYLSRFKTISALQHKSKSSLNKSINTRSVLVIFQFIITFY